MRNLSIYLAAGAIALMVGLVADADPQSRGTTPGAALATPAKLAISNTSLPAATANAAWSATIKATGGTAPYAFAAAGLPKGAAIAKTTGAIAGTLAATDAGAYTVTVTVTDSTKPTAQTATAKLALTVAPPKLVITTVSLVGARVGWAYSGAIAAAYGKAPYTFAVTGLPAGLDFNSATGAITGEPAASVVGMATLSLKVTDSTKPAAETATATLDLPVYQSAANEVCGYLNLGHEAAFNGFVPFANNAWTTDISNAPLDPNSGAITSAAGFAGLYLHPDFSGPDYGYAGIPYTIVDSSAQPLAPIDVIDYPDESDVAMMPMPLDAPIEGSPADCDGWPDTYVGDAHVLVVDRNTCMLYETFNTHRCKGKWNSSSETIWDLKKGEMRPWGWTSGDAAGLPIFEGLVRWDEIQTGAIHHAIRFTMEVTKNDANDGYFVEPATHAAGVYWGVSNVMGMRIRLKSSFDISSFSKTNQIILTAMKKYGMILADNGGYFFFQGAPNPNWDDDDLDNLKGVPSSAFEVVQMTPGWPGWDSSSAPVGTVPKIASFTASAATVKAGTPVTLKWTTANDSYDFIDKLGGVRGPSVTVKPTATTTYTLNATNQYGRATAAVTVTVE